MFQHHIQMLVIANEDSFNLASVPQAYIYFIPDILLDHIEWLIIAIHLQYQINIIKTSIVDHHRNNYSGINRKVQKYNLTKSRRNTRINEQNSSSPLQCKFRKIQLPYHSPSEKGMPHLMHHSNLFSLQIINSGLKQIYLQPPRSLSSSAQQPETIRFLLTCCYQYTQIVECFHSYSKKPLIKIHPIYSPSLLGGLLTINRYHFRMSTGSYLLIILMIRIVYSPTLAIAEFTIIIIAFAAVFLLGVVQNIEEYFLRIFTKGLLYGGQASISIGIAVAVDFQGGILILLIFRTLSHILTEEVTYFGTIVPAVSWYLFFKMTVIVLAKLKTKQISNPRSKEEREQYTNNEDNRSLISIIVLLLSSMVLIDYSMSSKNNFHINSIVALINFTAFLLELWIMNNSDEQKFRIIANLLPYNLYLYFVQIIFFGKFFYGQYLYFSQQTLIFSIIFFFIMRIIIGSRSQKFNKSDSVIFNLTYALGNSKRPKQYLFNKNASRTLRVLDKSSRQFASLIYFLSFLVTFSSSSHFYLIFSTIIINYFPIEQQNQRMINFLQKLFNIKINLRLKISIPIIILLYWIITQETSKKQQLFDEINSCSTSIKYQMILCFGIFITAFLGQYLQQEIKFKIFRIVEMIAPLLLFGWFFWLQCMNMKILILGVYVIIFCLDTIQQQRRSRVKQSKKD